MILWQGLPLLATWLFCIGSQLSCAICPPPFVSVAKQRPIQQTLRYDTHLLCCALFDGLALLDVFEAWVTSICLILFWKHWECVSHMMNAGKHTHEKFLYHTLWCKYSTATWSRRSTICLTCNPACAASPRASSALCAITSAWCAYFCTWQYGCEACQLGDPELNNGVWFPVLSIAVPCFTTDGISSADTSEDRMYIMHTIGSSTRSPKGVWGRPVANAASMQ